MNNSCAECKLPYRQRICKSPDGISPEGCTTVQNADILSCASAEYSREDITHFAQEAVKQEAAGYLTVDDLRLPVKTRIEETVEFCKRMGYQRLGLAFCGGLREEAQIVEKVLCNHGFEVKSVICKVGGIDKSFLGISDEDKIAKGGHETMCNPIAQAMILNKEKTQFNILLGLCVGHDSLFLKYAEAMCTVLAVKDRKLGNNPLACIYTSNMYYKYLVEEKN